MDRNKPRTVHTYWERLRTFFRWAVEEGAIPVSPMAGVDRPVARADQIQPFVEQHIAGFLEAARRSRYALRDTAIILFLVDTGARASEVCGLRRTDLDLDNLKAIVVGKGNKRRTLKFLPETRQALQEYFNSEPGRTDDVVFRGERGGSLTRSGLQQLIGRLGRSAGISGVRCSPHTFRHTAAIWTIRNGMNVFTLQTMLGHTDLAMTRKYVAIAQADLEKQHELYSPLRRVIPLLADPLPQ